MLILISLRYKTNLEAILDTASVKRGLIIIMRFRVILASHAIVDVDDAGALILINANYVWGPISFLIIAVSILAPSIIFKTNGINCVKV